jgi:hypothetical protein
MSIKAGDKVWVWTTGGWSPKRAYGREMTVDRLTPSGRIVIGKAQFDPWDGQGVERCYERGGRRVLCAITPEVRDEADRLQTALAIRTEVDNTSFPSASTMSEMSAERLAQIAAAFQTLKALVKDFPA